MGHILYLGHLIVVREDDRVTLLGEGSDLVRRRLISAWAPSADRGTADGARVGSSIGFNRRFLPYSRKPCGRRIPGLSAPPHPRHPRRRAPGARRRGTGGVLSVHARHASPSRGAGPSRRLSRAPARLEESIRPQLARKVDVAELSWLEQLETVGDPSGIRANGSSPPSTWAWFPSGSIRSCRRATGWHPVEQLPPTMASISRDLLAAQAPGQLSYTNIGFALAPETFTMSELPRSPPGSGLPRRPTNLRRIWSAAGYSRPPASIRSSSPGGGRPAMVYRFPA